MKTGDLISKDGLIKEIDSYVFDTVNPDVRRGEHYAMAHIQELVVSQPAVCNEDSIIIKREDAYKYLEDPELITLDQLVHKIIRSKNERE